MGMGVEGEEDLVITKEKKSKKKKMSDNENGLFDEEVEGFKGEDLKDDDKKKKSKKKKMRDNENGLFDEEVEGIKGEDLKDDDKKKKKREKKEKKKNKGSNLQEVNGEGEDLKVDDKKKKKREKKEKKKNKGSDLQEVNGEGEEQVLEKEYSLGLNDEEKKKLKSEKREKKEKKNKGNDMTVNGEELVGEKGIGETNVSRKRKLVSEEHVEEQRNDSELGVLKKEKKRKKEKKEKDKGSSDVDESMRKKANSVKDVEDKKVNEGESTTKDKEDGVDCSGNPESKKPSKRVKFSKNIEVFPLSDEDLDPGKKTSNPRKKRVDRGSTDVNRDKKDSNHGKRFTKEEDCIIQNAVLNYIKEHDLGDNGLEKILHCQDHPEVKNCWKEIATCMDWRSKTSIYSRAHILFERAEKREWTPEEKELLRKFHEEHGSDWKNFAAEYGKSRIHTKDTWRRICLPNHKKGHWSQDEYQKLFDLVNMDLLMKVYDEKKSKHGMLRDNISWEAISQRLSTRTMAECCTKWYYQLESPLIRAELWANTDDILMLNALNERDFSSEEEVDWDNLLEHRSGDLCRKRWQQMVKHLGEHGLKEFADQVETLANRYSVDVLEARKIYQEKTPVD
ncbi:hypothetical protein AQUCO_03900038v1 [Aquilegia coerulea]|uniref:Myb-like domain-containing protein n=1 Tax=Aquilegia coerulea TaxID=218851 RepID=A0A2G5CRU6_AQUCA|nr:hypothetical protein AQUCO_03900038v1 [Aquilegia coerulea]PIA33909.1 hypothetical protein AQUCO_03900038v1 [Aquilegia coerulea]PIA33910.1 hypothetical protein AQUCO_03900038v1 [Aquilegia coerulea]PIA33911.1 hypothetical protein AQUCO_03900038v1 [Aquilegia coerulea]